MVAGNVTVAIAKSDNVTGYQDKTMPLKYLASHGKFKNIELSHSK